MKSDIHPAYFPNATVTCACGTVRTVGSTMKEIRVEICSACHPFFTGEQKIIDTAGRVEKFKKRSETATTFAPKKKKNVVRKAQASEKQKAAVKKTKVVKTVPVKEAKI